MTEQNADNTSDKSIEDSIERLVRVAEAPALADRVAEVLSKTTPHAVFLGLLFEDKDEEGNEFPDITTLGSSDEVLQQFCEFEELPSEGPLSRPRFDFDLSSMQSALPKIISHFDCFIYNLSGKAVLASAAIDWTEAAIEEIGEYNTFSPGPYAPDKDDS